MTCPTCQRPANDRRPAMNCPGCNRILVGCRGCGRAILLGSAPRPRPCGMCRLIGRCEPDPVLQLYRPPED